MTLPGTTVISRESPPSSSAEIDTGTLFVAGLTDRGPVDEALPVRNLAQAVAKYGDRVSYGLLYDTLETFFREGGARAYVSRVVGPAAAKATATLSDGSGNTLTITAVSAGAWANGATGGLSIVVTHPSGGTFTIAVRENGVIKEQSPTLSTNADAVAWAANSDYITITDLAGGDPAVATTNLAGGADDRGSIVDAQWQTALDLFTKDLGPGQVAFPGRTTDAAHTALLAHAAAKNRFALLDGADTSDVPTLTASAAAQRSTSQARYGALFAPWAVIPGESTGTTRTVPYSAVQAGLIARLEAAGGSQNDAAAGDSGVAQYAIGLSQAAWSDANREVLNDAGVNVALTRFGSIRTYGYRTLVDPLTAPDWLEMTNARLNMAISAEADSIAESFEFKTIDGQRKELSKFGGELSGMLIPYYESGALYGETFADAAVVNVGPQVNTDETIAAQEIHAVIAVRMSPFAERVIIEIAKVPITEALS